VLALTTLPRLPGARVASTSFASAIIEMQGLERPAIRGSARVGGSVADTGDCAPFRQIEPDAVCLLGDNMKAAAEGSSSISATHDPRIMLNS
jgi:hypothetical protein